MSTYPGEADGHDIDIDYEDCSDELDTEKVRWGMSDMTSKIINELKQALAEKDRLIDRLQQESQIHAQEAS